MALFGAVRFGFPVVCGWRVFGSGRSRWAFTRANLRRRRRYCRSFSRGSLVALVREIRALERVVLEVVHLPLARNLPLDVVALGDLPASLAEADDVLWGRDVRRAGLPYLVVVVGEDDVILRRRRESLEDLVGVVDALPICAGGPSAR